MLILLGVAVIVVGFAIRLNPLLVVPFWFGLKFDETNGVIVGGVRMAIAVAPPPTPSNVSMPPAIAG